MKFKRFHAAAAKLLQSCPTLCDPIDSSPPGSSVHGVFQPRILEWVAISFSRGSYQPRDRTLIACVVDRLFITEPPGKPMYTRLDFKWITNKDLLYSTGNSAQCYVAGWMRAELGGECMHV